MVFKKKIKIIIHIILKILVLPLYILHRLEGFFLGRESSFMGWSQLISLIPGLYGSWIRRAFYCWALDKCANDSCLEFGSTFVSRQCRIGSGVYIGSRCIISHAHIDKDVLIGSGVHILSGKKQHIFDDIDTPIRFQGGEKCLITIGEDCWIGEGSIIMADIGRKCIVAAGSVVTKEVEDFSIVAGNPARLLRKRT